MPAHSRWSDAKVGIFVLIALGILIAGSLWIAGGSLFGLLWTREDGKWKLVSYQPLNP